LVLGLALASVLVCERAMELAMAPTWARWSAEVLVWAELWAVVSAVKSAGASEAAGRRE
jgi:hypothetical protein